MPALVGKLPQTVCEEVALATIRRAGRRALAAADYLDNEMLMAAAAIAAPPYATLI